MTSIISNLLPDNTYYVKENQKSFDHYVESILKYSYTFTKGILASKKGLRFEKYPIKSNTNYDETTFFNSKNLNLFTCIDTNIHFFESKKYQNKYLIDKTNSFTFMNKKRYLNIFGSE